MFCRTKGPEDWLLVSLPRAGLRLLQRVMGAWWPQVGPHREVTLLHHTPATASAAGSQGKLLHPLPPSSAFGALWGLRVVGTW